MCFIDMKQKLLFNCLNVYSVYERVLRAIFVPSLDFWKQVQWPSERFYWGYIWNGGPGRPVTQPIRDPRNKSWMPPEQVNDAVDLFWVQRIGDVLLIWDFTKS